MKNGLSVPEEIERTGSDRNFRHSRASQNQAEARHRIRTKPPLVPLVIYDRTCVCSFASVPYRTAS